MDVLNQLEVAMHEWKCLLGLSSQFCMERYASVGDYWQGSESKGGMGPVDCRFDGFSPKIDCA